MNDFINSLLVLDKNSENYFCFSLNNPDPIKHLKDVSRTVPNTSGLYFVFIEGIFNIEFKHLVFEFNKKEYSLIYFGKAGGFTKNGKPISQGLKGRINNVTSDSEKKIKDMKRGKYWNLIMNESNINDFIIRYVEESEPLKIESKIYELLNSNNLEYPYLNKKLGRKKT